MEKNVRLLKELARDLIAMGSIPFLALTVVRVSAMSPYYPSQFLISSGLFFVFKLIFKAEMRAGIGFILLVFTSLFYQNWLFAVFALIVYAGIIISLFYLGKDKKDVVKGVIFGFLSSGIGYVLVRAIF